MLALAIVLGVVAVSLLRAGWGRDRRLAIAGWALGLATLVWLAVLEGAWGVSVGFVAVMAAAAVLLLHAAAVSPARAGRRTAEPAGALARAGNLRIARRLAVFALVVPVSFLAAQIFAFGLNAVIKGDAALEANSVATMFFVQPVLWAVLMTWQMTLSDPRRMIAPPFVVAAAGILLWSLA